MGPLRLLSDRAKELSITLTDQQLSLFSAYLKDLKRWNRVHNLTAIRDDEGIVLKHFIDSLSYLKAIPLRKGLRIIDIGTGAGFPGLPIRIVRPEILLTLIDSSMKKILFLRHICRALGLEDIEIVQERFENLEGDFGNSFDILITRALSKVKDVLRYGAPLLKKGGLIVISKGPALETEVRSAEKDMLEAGARIRDIIDITLPGSNLKRKIIVFEKNYT